MARVNRKPTRRDQVRQARRFKQTERRLLVESWQHEQDS